LSSSDSLVLLVATSESFFYIAFNLAAPGGRSEARGSFTPHFMTARFDGQNEMGHADPFRFQLAWDRSPATSLAGKTGGFSSTTYVVHNKSAPEAGLKQGEYQEQRSR